MKIELSYEFIINFKFNFFVGKKLLYNFLYLTILFLNIFSTIHVELSLKQVAATVAKQATITDDGTASSQLQDNIGCFTIGARLMVQLKQRIDESEKRLDVLSAQSVAAVAPPVLNLPVERLLKVPTAVSFPLWGRLRRDVCIEHLAGSSKLPEIVRPVQMNLVPDMYVFIISNLFSFS